MTTARGTGIIVVVAGLAAVAGSELHRAPSLPVVAWIAAAPALVLLLYVLLRGPTWCLAAAIVLDIFGLYKVALSAGPGNLRLFDIPYVALVAWVMVERSREGPRPRARLGQVAIALWLMSLGVSLYPVAIHERGAATGAIIDWLRIVQTFSLIWLVPYAIRKLRDLEFLLGVTAFAITLEIGGATVAAVAQRSLSARFRLAGGNSANTTGLLAALLILMAVHSPVPRRRSLRLLMLVVGVAGLVLARSLGAIAAVAVALVIFGMRPSRSEHDRLNSRLLLPTRVILVALAAFTIAASVKGENLPGSSSFKQSSTVHRTILATAGLELFVDHPITGVGWESAPSPAEARTINTRLKRIFGKNVNPEFFPDATMPGRIFEHNAYVQILAEGGLLGFGLFLIAALSLAFGMRDVLVRARSDPNVYAAARCIAVMLVAIVVWLNDNTLFGVQPETVLAATLIGAMASVPLLLGSASSANERLDNELMASRAVLSTSE